MSDKIKLLLVWSAAILFIIALAPMTKADTLYKSVIRLHVLAQSDSEEDQKLKLAVRDEILDFTSKEFGNITSLEEAKEAISENKEIIQKIAEQKIKDEGKNFSVKVTFDEEEYPTREYGTLAFPKGKYLSLRVIIGSGEGKNWWCVLFPPVCLNSAQKPEKVLEDGGLSENDIKLVTRNGKKYKIRFKLLEVLGEFQK